MVTMENSGITIQEISGAPAALKDGNALEFVVFIDDTSAKPFPLSEDLKIMCEHLEEEIQTKEELDQLQSGFVRLADVLTSSKPKPLETSYK
jgi:hypothetical protein